MLGRARRAATGRCKSDWGHNLGEVELKFRSSNVTCPERIYGTDLTVVNWKSKLSTTPLPSSVKYLVNLGPLSKTYRRAGWPTHDQHCACSVVTACGIRNVATSGILTRFSPKLWCPQSDLQPRAASRWALPIFLVFIPFNMHSTPISTKFTRV